MYTLEQLQQKTLKELKEIGWELNVMPEGDRRCRQNWIDALVGKTPPLLQLLEAPSADSEPVEEVFEFSEEELDRLQEMREYYRENEDLEPPEGLYLTADEVANELLAAFPPSPIETSPAVEVETVQEAIEIQRLEPIESKFGRIAYPKATVKSIAHSDIQEAAPSMTGLHKAIDKIKEMGGFGAISVGDRVEAVNGAVLTKTSDDSFVFEAAKTSLGAEIKPRIDEHLKIDQLFTRDSTDCPACGGINSLYAEWSPKLGNPFWNIFCHECESSCCTDQLPHYLADEDNGDTSPGVSFDSEEFRQTHAVEIENYFASFNDEQPPNRGDGKGRLEIEPRLSQSAIEQVVENSPGVNRKTSTAHQLLELFKASAHIIEDSPTGETEAKVTQSVIEPAAKNHLDEESDLNPILTGLTFSPGFLARYSPPQSALMHFKTDADGQLNLLDYEVETFDEPPEPDDFKSLDAFREAIALWYAEHPEPPEVSLDSFCEWAPCPDDWYEPAALLELSSVMELSPAIESSSTYNFSIPTFGAWCDRANRQNDTDEPPDTGIFARLPKPKPPSFPPRAIGQSHDRHINSTQTQTYCMAAAGSSRSGRSPPGGDVM